MITVKNIDASIQESQKIVSHYLNKMISYRDITILLGLISMISILVFTYFPIDLIRLQDVWFDADTYRISEGLLDNMFIAHNRSAVHPLFPIMSSPLPMLLTRFFSIDSAIALRVTTAALASIWITSLYLLLKLIGCPRLDSTVFSLLGLSSSGAMFWLTVPESYSYGSITILLALCFTSLTEIQSFSFIWYVAVSAMTFSMTVTNWMFGIVPAIINNSRKKTFQILLITLGSVALLTVFQKLIFRYATILNPMHFRGESQYSSVPTTSKFILSSISFWLHSMVMPKINLGSYLDQGGFLTLSIQKSLPLIGEFWSCTALIAWVLLLALGLWSIVVVKTQRKLRLSLGIGLVGQFGLHLIYGTETFLYALHFIPLLVPLAALTILTSRRWIALTLAVVFIVSSCINNSLQFQQAILLIQ